MLTRRRLGYIHTPPTLWRNFYCRHDDGLWRCSRSAHLHRISSHFPGCFSDAASQKLSLGTLESRMSTTIRPYTLFYVSLFCSVVQQAECGPVRPDQSRACMTRLSLERSGAMEDDLPTAKSTGINGAVLPALQLHLVRTRCRPAVLGQSKEFRLKITIPESVRFVCCDGSKHITSLYISSRSIPFSWSCYLTILWWRKGKLDHQNRWFSPFCINLLPVSPKKRLLYIVSSR